MHLEAEAADEGAVVHALLAQYGNVMGTLNEQGIQLVILQQILRSKTYSLACPGLDCGPSGPENLDSESCHLL